MQQKPSLEELAKKLRSTGGKPPKIPPARTAATEQPYSPLPLECIPEPVRSLVIEGSRSLDCDSSFVALPALAVVGAAIGNTRHIQLKKGFQQPAVIWTAVVGRSGSLKTPSFRLATNYFNRIQHHALLEYHREKEEYEAALKAFEYREREAFKKGDGVSEQRPPKPVAKRIVTNDCTMEALFPILEDNPRGLLVCRDELAGWIGSMTRYRSSGSDVQSWLELYDAGSIVVDRKGGDKTTRAIQRASVCITGGIQPGTLRRSLTDDYLEAGLGARFMMAYPPERKRKWVESEIDIATLYKWDRLLEALLQLEFAPGHEADRTPIVLHLHKDAKPIWVRWYNGWAAVIAETADEFLRSAYAKVHGQAARLALIHHVIETTWAGCHGVAGHGAIEVGTESVTAGTRLAQWFAGEAKRIYQSAAPEAVLVDWIAARGGRCTVRDLITGKKFSSSNDAFLFLDELVNSNRGVWGVEGKKKFFCLLPFSSEP